MLSVGATIKELRIKNNMSQKELADLISMDTSYFSKIEQGKRNIADEYLIKLSAIFNKNLISLKNTFNDFYTFDDYEHYYLLRELIENRDIDTIEKWLILNKNLLNYGESLLLKSYCSALVKAVKYKEYKASNDICFNVLEINTSTSMKTIENKMYSNSVYSMFVLITYNYTKLSEYDIAVSLCDKIIDHYNVQFNDKHFCYLNQNFFFKKTYITLLNNYVYILFKKSEYIKALEICNIAINKSKTFNILNQLYSLLEVKFEILYKLNDLKLSYNTYNQLKILCEITENREFFSNTKKLVKEKYPLLEID